MCNVCHLTLLPSDINTHFGDTSSVFMKIKMGVVRRVYLVADGICPHSEITLYKCNRKFKMNVCRYIRIIMDMLI